MVTAVRRGPQPFIVSRDRWDEVQMELAERRRDALTLCDVVEARLRAVEPALYEIGPAAYQHGAAALVAIRRYRARNER